MHLPAELLFLFLLAAPEANAGSDTVVIADYFDFANAPAFYVDAPHSIQTQMKNAVGKYRQLNEVACHSSQPPFWLCSNAPLRYFRAITGKGQRRMSGYVCQDVDWLQRHKYYPVKELTDATCVHAQWDVEQRTYNIDWPRS